MQFTSLALQELTAVADRLSAVSAKEVETATQHLTESFQGAIEALRAEKAQLVVENEGLTAAKGRLETREKQFEAVKGQLEARRNQLESEKGQLEARKNQLESEKGQIEARKNQLESEKGRLEARKNQLETEKGQLEARKNQLETEKGQLEARKNQLESEKGRLEAERGELSVALARAEVSAHESEKALLENKVAVRQAEAARERETGARAAAELELHQLRQLLDSAHSDTLRINDELEQQIADKAVMATELEAARSRDRGTLLHRLQTAFEQGARSTSVEDVLVASARGLTEDFTRAAVFVVKDNRLEAAWQSGFDAHSGLAKVVIPLGVDSLLAQTASADGVRAFPADSVEDPALALFGGSPSLIVTAPVKVRGETLAVIYADDAGGRPLGAVADDAARLVDLLRSSAMLRLERLTLELKAIAELRSYARMLLDEVEYVYSADARAGKSDSDRLERLQQNLRCAREIYQQRVSPEGPAAAALLGEEIAAATGKQTHFGRELAVVAARTHTALDQVSAKAAAQAS
jgi:peptidoglycan hydrolase CwlO-like protein